MDVFSLLSYINKVSLFAFFITTLVVVYQIYILKKEKSKEKAPTIPDFKEKNNSGFAANYTNLPSSLTKKEPKAVNYSKLFFLIISLLTIIIVTFVVSLIKKNNVPRNEALIQPTITPTTVKAKVNLIPTPKKSLIPSPTNVIPTVLPTLTPYITENPTVTPTGIKPTDITPTEIILAQGPTLTPAVNPTGSTANKPQVLPETGSWEKGLLIIGVAISTIFFSFWF